MSRKILDQCPVVPVVVLTDANDARGHALLAGGITVIEVTLRTPAGLAAIRALANALPELTVAAGSVLTPDHVDQVIDAGAELVVSPGLSTAVLDRAQHHGVPALPGVASASEIMSAVNYGLAAVKFFPANLLGGPAMIRALNAPFTSMTFMPSGGVSVTNMGDYLALPCVPAVSGSWMVDPALINQQDWEEITKRSASAISTAEECKLAS
jgi:2-dehydro-3-deoxyphosphogluconate aldolase/(4S)-4-hydroxy-2-oxoglutarate aldolase